MVVRPVPVQLWDVDQGGSAWAWRRRCSPVVAHAPRGENPCAPPCRGESPPAHPRDHHTPNVRVPKLRNLHTFTCSSVQFSSVHVTVQSVKAVSLIHAYHTTAKDRRASTAHPACFSQNGGAIHARPQRRIPPQGCTSIFLKRQGGDWYSHLLTTKPRQTNECRALHAHLDMPLTIADLARSARPETSRFPMTRTAPRLAPTT
jgi:hypothetical protein